MISPGLHGSSARGLLALAAVVVATCQYCPDSDCSVEVSLLQKRVTSQEHQQRRVMKAATVPERDSKDLVGILRQVFGVRGLRIPNQLILTGKPDTLEEMDADVLANVLNTIQLSGRSIFSVGENQALPVRPRWFGDRACHSYISDHYDAELLGFFQRASPGYYRGDICRAAVLYREGGFYTDVDVELAVPLPQLVDENTTFMSAYSVNGDIFNGLIATVPNSGIMAETLQEIRRWYRNESQQDGLMGTMTMLRALENTVAISCPNTDLAAMQNVAQWECGNHRVRLYHEAQLICSAEDGIPECPKERKDVVSAKMQSGLNLGLFSDVVTRSFIGWPRFHTCKGSPEQTGCGSGGHEA